MKSYKKNKSNILILGIASKEGSLLASNHLKNNNSVHGYLIKKKENLKNLKRFKILDKIKLFNYSNIAIESVIQKNRYHRIYFLSKNSLKVQNPKFNDENIKGNTKILIQILEHVRKNNLKKIHISNVYLKEISHKKGKKNNNSIINTSINLVELYKSIEMEIVKAYRKQFRIKVFNTILFDIKSLSKGKETLKQKFITLRDD